MSAIAQVGRVSFGRLRHPLRGGTGRTRKGSRFVEIGSLIGGLVLWEVLGRTLALPFLPPFSACLAALVDLNNQNLIIPDLIDSVQALAVGFVGCLAVSLILAFLMAEFELVNLAVGPYVYAFFLLPSIAIAPVFLAIFGVSNLTRTGIIFIYPLFYMVLNFHTAFTQRDAGLLEMAQSYQASRWQRSRFVVIPSALPLVMATIRVGLSRAVKGMINGEQFIAVYGLGGLVQTFGGQFAADKVFAVIIVIVALALVLDVITRLLDQRWTRWATP
ncbi:MAG TPA: ABC transporter permease subunit [Candidatus Limnocylindrales bacterium]|jgi:NitT/TauT family transport system permease protein|nr:ABC transporter permease subunit [Candidatus Limnocylindrales bacterium]